MTDFPDDVESKRQTCFQLAATAFSENQLDLDGYEVLAGQIAGADDIQSIMVIESSLPQPQHRSLETQIVTCDKSRTYKLGKWIESYSDPRRKTSDWSSSLTAECQMSVSLRLETSTSSNGSHRIRCQPFGTADAPK